MHNAAGDLEFEEAARLRDEIHRLETVELGLTDPEPVGPHGFWISKTEFNCFKTVNFIAKPSRFLKLKIASCIMHSPS